MGEVPVPGSRFPDLTLPNHSGEPVTLSAIPGDGPFLVAFVRGWWCPKEQVRVRGLVDMQDEIQREYGKIVAITTDEPYVNGAFRAGLGADFPFLSDADRRVAEELGILELTDAKHRPFLPMTFVLDSALVVRGVWCGFWYWGNPTPEELRLALREITREEQPTYEPLSAWRDGTDPGAGPAGPVIWIREDGEGREIWRHAHTEAPEPGAEVERSEVDGRAWVVASVEEHDGRLVVRLRKVGESAPARFVRHGITAPRWIR